MNWKEELYEGFISFVFICIWLSLLSISLVVGNLDEVCDIRKEIFGR